MLFDDFNFDSLDDPEFKEDAVREDIVAPLLKWLGYSSSGRHRMVRSRKLTHPFVLIGSKKHKVNIVPDYLLEVDDTIRFVLDAKSPTQEVEGGDNVAQVYSYAIHPEVRVTTFGLCNGRRLALFDIFKVGPVKVYDLTELSDNDLLDIAQKLKPSTIGQAGTLRYDLDAGFFLFMFGFRPNQQLIFFDVIIPLIHMIAKDAFTTNVLNTSLTDRPVLMTFDYSRQQLDQLLSIVDPAVASTIERCLQQRPFRYKNNEDPPTVHVRCRLGDAFVTSRKGETFLPLKVDEFFQSK